MLTKAESALYGDKTKSYAFGLRTVAARKRALTKLVEDGNKKNTPTEGKHARESTKGQIYCRDMLHSAVLYCGGGISFVAAKIYAQLF